MWTREEQKIIDKLEELIDSESSSIWDNFLELINENDLNLPEVLFILYEAGHIKFPDYFGIDING